MKTLVLSKLRSYRERLKIGRRAELSQRKRVLSFIGFSRLWRPFIISVPVDLRTAILQRELFFSSAFLKGTLLVWTVWWTFLILFSDTQKTNYKWEYITIRICLIAISLIAVGIIHSEKLTRTRLSILSITVAFLYMSSVVLFSFMPLPMRTLWLAIVPSTIIMTTPKSGRNAIVVYSIFLTIGLLAFQQPINTMTVVSEIGFGAFFIGAGLIVKLAMLNSEVLALENAETQKNALLNEMKIVDAIERFIPKVIRNRIKLKVNSGESVASVINELSQPREQHLAVLYSDFRNYSQRSSNVEFIKNDLIMSSYPILDLAEKNEAIVQNRGDSLLAAFMGDDPTMNCARAMHTALISSICENDRVKKNGKSIPDRYMIVTSGTAVFCSLGQNARQELTIAGKPVNLAARLDEVTKHPRIATALQKNPSVLTDEITITILRIAGLNLKAEEFDLPSENIQVRTYEEEKLIFLIQSSQENIELIEKFTKSTKSEVQAA